MKKSLKTAQLRCKIFLMCLPDDPAKEKDEYGDVCAKIEDRDQSIPEPALNSTEEFA
jgi:hypothetical protein